MRIAKSLLGLLVFLSSHVDSILPRPQFAPLYQAEREHAIADKYIVVMKPKKHHNHHHVSDNEIASSQDQSVNYLMDMPDGAHMDLHHTFDFVETEDTAATSGADNQDSVGGGFLTEHSDLSELFRFQKRDQIMEQEVTIAHEDKGWHGFAATMNEHAVRHFRSHPDVLWIEQDKKVYIAGRISTQMNATWGLQRVSQHPSLSDDAAFQFTYPQSAGAGVNVYVIDTGIRISHKDFQGRAHWGITVPDGDEDHDGNGHGTHVAATIVGSGFGIAKKAHVYAVKVLRSDGSGTTADVIKGIEWVLKEHKKAKDTNKSKAKTVANMSLGGSKSRIMDMAVNKAVKSGVHFVVAAGNSYEDACDYSPAGASGPVTVAASDVHDQFASFSNFGKCVTLIGPGVDITSAWNSGDHSHKTISGTSMASPHVAGVMATMLGAHNYTPEELKSRLIKSATTKLITRTPPNTPNLLVFLDARKP